MQCCTVTLTLPRGSPPVPPVDIRPDHRHVVLYRRTHPSCPLHGDKRRRDGSSGLMYRHRGRLVHLWRVQDVLYVSALYICLCYTPELGCQSETVRRLTRRSGATGGIGGYLYGATSTMVVGGLAAGAAFGLVKALGVKE